VIRKNGGFGHRFALVGWAFMPTAVVLIISNAVGINAHPCILIELMVSYR
jgi:hypothetical protein